MMRSFVFRWPFLLTVVSCFSRNSFQSLSTRKWGINSQHTLVWGTIENGGEVGSGPNWIERSFPIDLDESKKFDPKTVVDYDLGISGVNYQIGPLSKRMFDAIAAKSSIFKDASLEIRRGFLIYTMDFTAKEAVRAALTQNGLELVLTDEEQDEGLWSDVDSIKLLDENGSPIPGKIYDSWEDAVDHWVPGQAFDFVARQVPAKMKELSLDQLLWALDPNGELRKQAKSAGLRLPDENIGTLHDMAQENLQRAERAPTEANDESQAYSGLPEKRGYRVINADDLLGDRRNDNGTENEKVLMHVMDSMVNHGCLIVDLTNGGKDFEKAWTISSMWKTTRDFFDKIANRMDEIPAMMTLDDVGSQHAKVGFATYQGGDMQFLETRLDRTGNLYPVEARQFFGPDGCASLRDSFQIVARIGKDIVRIITGASIRENGLLEGAEAAEAAILLADELVDDGIAHEEGRVSMSPHRLCLYSNKKQLDNPEIDSKKKETTKTVSTREIFGAHTDSTFVTAIPVAAISGLEVFDEDADEWYRPELAARRHWELQRTQAGLDSKVYLEIVNGMELPWHSRYVVFLPGEFLQLCSRNEVLAAVHRVVANEKGPPRLSAPILLRGRPGMKMNVQRYLGGFADTEDTILRQCDGMTLAQIHDEMQQPASFQ